MFTGQDWMVGETGQCQLCSTPREWNLLETPYYFHRFLTETEDVLKQSTTADQCDCLPQLRRLVRKLVINSYWLQTQRPESSSLREVATLNLYDEIGYPLTVQIETYQRGAQSSIHNHGTWGIVTILQGLEKNMLWQRTPEPQFPDKIIPVEEKILGVGDVISFTPTAIHSIEAMGEQELVTFNLYGETNGKQRFQIDPITYHAKPY